VGGVQDILGTFSALFEDAITDELADVNPVRGVRVKANDPRVRKPTRELRVWTFDQMHEFAQAARGAAWGGKHPEQADQVEAMIRSLSDGAFRLGEMLGLHRKDFDGQLFRLRGTAHNGRLIEGNTETKKHVREVPCPPGLAGLIQSMPTRIDTPVLFPTLSGRLWWARNFYRDVWAPTVRASGMVCTPHEFRHSYLTHLRAMGVHDADLAEVAGHGLDTLIGRYSHPVRRSFEQIREVIG
jgi:integrase